METLLVFLAIAAIQMLVAYTKQKKEAAKKANTEVPEPLREKESEFEFKSIYEFEPKPTLEHELESDIEPVRAAHPHPVSSAATPLQARNSAQHNSQLSTLNSQLNLKNPAQGILWAAILHEPRYRVKWKQR